MADSHRFIIKTMYNLILVQKTKHRRITFRKPSKSLIVLLVDLKMS